MCYLPYFGAYYAAPIWYTYPAMYYAAYPYYYGMPSVYPARVCYCY